MAIGDKPNQNLFGTNYNPEDEEEKKARLAAQGAMMGAGSPTVVGAGNIPAAAFGQAPTVAPFSIEAAGQVNPMMQPQSLEVPLQAPVTFIPYADDVAPPPASALSVFTPGGEVKPNIDVNAITPSPEMTSTSAVNTALNQEVAVGSPIVENDPSVMSKVGSFLFPYGLGGVNRPTPGLAQGETALEATQGVTPPAQRPMAGAQEQPEAVVSPFLQSPDTPSDLGGGLLRGFEMVNDAARGPNAPMGQDATRAALGGMTLNEYLNAPAGTPGVSGLQTDPQGRMITPSAQPTVAALLSSFDRDSLARQQQIGGTGSFEGDSAAREARLRAEERQPGETQTQRDTRVAQSRTTGGQTQGLSFDDARRRAEGELAESGVKNPSASQVNALARLKQAEEPERLAELETKRALDAIKLRDAEAKKDFKPQVVEIGDQKLIQLSPSYYQPVRPEPTAEEPFEPRVLEEGGFTYYETAPNRFERQPSTKTGGATGAVSSIIDETIAAGGGVATPAPTVDTPGVAAGDEFTPKQEADIQAVMGTNPTRSRAEVIEAMQTQGAL